MIHYIRISEETQGIRRSVQRKVTYSGKHKKHRCEGREKTWQAGQRGPSFAFSGIFAAAKTPLCLSGATPLRPLERAASSRTPYPSPSRKRQGSSTPSLVLSPKSHGFSGYPVCAAARFCETLRSVTVIAGHAPFSFPPRARFCPAYDPRSACGAAARASHRANAGIWHTLPFSPIAAWRIPPASS